MDNLMHMKAFLDSLNDTNVSINYTNELIIKSRKEKQNLEDGESWFNFASFNWAFRNYGNLA